MILQIFLFLLIITLLFYSFLKPLPLGTGVISRNYPIHSSKVQFLYDLTWFEDGARKSEMHIFEEIKNMLAKSQKFFVLDMFLFNANLENIESFRPITRELVSLMIQKKKDNPYMDMVVITDPLNSFYGCYFPQIYTDLEDAGIEVTETDINQLRDTNYVYAAFWRLVLRWVGKWGGRWVQDPLSTKKRYVTVSSVLLGLNARANHRKVIIADDDGEICALISSANIHEASSWFTNTGIKFYGEPAHMCLDSEEAIAKFSGEAFYVDVNDSKHQEGDVNLQVIMEHKLKGSLIESIQNAEKGDSITVVMLFIADFGITEALLAASKKGVHVILVLDRNVDSFGRKKMGLPNQIIANRLHRKSKGEIEIRWWANKVDQLHTKMMLIEKKDYVIAYVGSANYTVRNVSGGSLEVSVRLETSLDNQVYLDMKKFSERVRSKPFTRSFHTLKKTKYLPFKYLLFYIQRITGFTTY